MNNDIKTAEAFAKSWNDLPLGSIYTRDQFEDWFYPLTRSDIKGKTVLELGCGNGSMLLHMLDWEPEYLEGVDLGSSVLSAESNLSLTGKKNYRIIKADLTEYKSQGFDVVYCIGVLHHLKIPKKGFEAVINNVKMGGRFHCWVYAKEGNLVIRVLVEPLRRIFSRFPWWFTKYFIAAPLAFVYFLYAKTLSMLPKNNWIKKIAPLYEYSLWIAKREYAFFRHVAFDQIVTPQTTYFDKKTIESWISGRPEIDPASVYIIMRNGNSWKFGGKKTLRT